MQSTDIIGRWRIVSWEQIYDDGRRILPMGPEPRGFIAYDADGRMTTMIANGERSPFAGGAQWQASIEEKAQAYDSFMAYCGRYEVEGDTIRHHVELATCPNWQGGVQIRSADLRDGRLHLSGRLEESTPQARTAELVWRRDIES